MLKAAITLPLLGLLSGAALQPTEPVFFDTGMWETSVTVVSIDAPSLPEEATRMIRTTLENLRASQCAGGATSNPLRDFKDGIVMGFAGTVPGGSCTFEDDRIGDGRFATQAVCRGPNAPVAITNNVRGSYTSSSFGGDFTITARPADGPAETPLVRIEGRVTSRITGPCPDPSV